MDKTAIVILNWNGIDYLKKFLGTVVSFSMSPGTTIYLADNSSTDDSVRWTEENHPSVRIIRLDKNHGFAGGYNIALNTISAEYYILLNSDIEVTPGWADSLTEFMDRHPDASACQPKILSWHTRDQFEYAGGAGGYIDKYGYPFCRGRVFHICEKDLGQYDNVCKIFWASGSCMIMRSEPWRVCGGLDPGFFAHMEEIDLCWRMLHEGYSIYYNPASEVFHVGGGSLPYETPMKTYLNFRNNLFLLYKNLPDRSRSITIFKRLLLDGIASLVFLFTGKSWKIPCILRAHIDYYKSLKSLKIKRKDITRRYPDNASELILNKSIVFEFFIKRNRTFQSLGGNLKTE
jgi:hypothetical protein